MLHQNVHINSKVWDNFVVHLNFNLENFLCRIHFVVHLNYDPKAKNCPMVTSVMYINVHVKSLDCTKIARSKFFIIVIFIIILIHSDCLWHCLLHGLSLEKAS